MSNSKRDVLSQRKIDSMLRYAELIQYSRNYPLWFVKNILGIELLDYQKYVFMNSWTTPFVVWTKSRSAGKSTMGAVFIMTKAMLFSNYQTYIIAAAGSQSQELFLKMEDIALKQISSFTGLTDVFANETVKNQSNNTGFSHNPASFEVSLYNGSTINSLNSVPDNIRSKRSNLNFYDEAGFISDELFEASEPFTVQNSNFRLGGDDNTLLMPQQVPNQLIYASSASATDTYYFKKYRDFAKKMFLGDSNYFVADINSDAVIGATFNGKLFPVPLLSQETVDAAMRANREKAMREYGNIFTTEGADQQIIKRATIIKNSELRPPTLYNEGGKQYAIAIDPARSFDNSIMTIAEIYKDKDVGYKMKLVNCVSFSDINKKKKTPMQTPEQVREFKKALLNYNGNKASDYENIHQVLIDDGAGGSGIAGWADNLLSDWVDESGRTRKGLIDTKHKEYENVVNNYPNSADKLTLTRGANKTEIFNALREMINHDLIEFTEDYDGKDSLVFVEENTDGTADAKSYSLSDDEILALTNLDRAKEELVNIYEFTSGSNVRYDLAPHQRNKMHDDRAYTIAMLAWYLQKLRRKEVVKQDTEIDISKFVGFKATGF